MRAGVSDATIAPAAHVSDNTLALTARLIYWATILLGAGVCEWKMHSERQGTRRETTMQARRIQRARGRATVDAGMERLPGAGAHARQLRRRPRRLALPCQAYHSAGHQFHSLGDGEFPRIRLRQPAWLPRDLCLRRRQWADGAGEGLRRASRRARRSRSAVCARRLLSDGQMAARVGRQRWRAGDPNGQICLALIAAISGAVTPTTYCHPSPVGPTWSHG